MAVQLSRDIT